MKVMKMIDENNKEKKENEKKSTDFSNLNDIDKAILDSERKIEEMEKMIESFDKTKKFRLIHTIIPTVD